MNIKDLPIEQLKESEYNPRAVTEKENDAIKRSLDKHDLVEPIVVNMAKGREYVIVGGHQRYRLLKERGDVTVPCSIVEKTLEEEQDLNLSLNHAQGHWDEEMILNMDEHIIQDVGLNIEQFSHEKELGGEEPERCSACHQVLNKKK